MKLGIVIPALNEEKTIGEVIDQIPSTFKGIKHIQIIVVDDASTDNTSKIALQKGAIVIRHGKNLGVGKAFQNGLEKALNEQCNIMVNIDADGQFDPKDIAKLLKPIMSNEADLVTASRFIDKSLIPKNMSFVKKWGNRRMANLISWATGDKFYDVSCGFRAYSLDAMLKLNLFGKFTYTQETFLDLAFKDLRIKEVPIKVKYFNDRKSRVAGSILNYTIKSANIIFRTIKDYKPLKFFVVTGSIIFLLGLALDIFVLHHYIVVRTFSPYKILGFLGAFLNTTGIMIVFIGILADLLDKVRITQEKILYYEKKKIYDQHIQTNNNR